MAVAGASFTTLLPTLGWEALDALLVLAAGYALFTGFESLSRRTGRFEEY
jgi:hypothetical protein